MGIKHKTVGAGITQTEFEAASSHVFDSNGVAYAAASSDTIISPFVTTNSFLMQNTASSIAFTSSPTLAGNLTISNHNLVTDTTSGSKIATGSTQKLGFFGATPVSQKLKASHNNWASIGDVVAALVSLGLFNAS